MSVKERKYYRAQEVTGESRGNEYLLDKIKTRTVAKAATLKELLKKIEKLTKAPVKEK
jgi:hypothetical protein